MLIADLPVHVLEARLAEAKDEATGLLATLGLKMSAKASYPCPQGFPEAIAYYRDLGANAGGYREGLRRMDLLLGTLGVDDAEIEAMQGEIDHLLEVLARFGWAPGKPSRQSSEQEEV